ncbi:hypothetical protein BDA96_01G405400 [Sorghum bicolor]|uniref:Secreted protein n=2 Tax=Sorghum bicolor TaxID=4558 RepID=A0A921S681_SORBI|nr:hypothetical protein BDA96_01G405400 [Sorghum bicolor]KXG39427.1 hypothetical protein SORBI_3001G381000 [Sorghum bicolor]
MFSLFSLQQQLVISLFCFSVFQSSSCSTLLSFVFQFYYSSNRSTPFYFGAQQFDNSKANRSSISELFSIGQIARSHRFSATTFHSFACMLSQWYSMLRSFAYSSTIHCCY